MSLTKPVCLFHGEYHAVENPSGVNLHFVSAASKHFTLVHYQDALKKSELAAQVVGAFVDPHENFLRDEQSVCRFPNLKIVCNHGVGLNHLDLKMLRKRNVRVANTPFVLCPAVADTALLLMLGVARNVRSNLDVSYSANMKKPNFMDLGQNVCKGTVGIIGLGGIGFEIAKQRARGFDMVVLYYQRTRRSEADEKSLDGATYYSQLQDMLPLCDFVVVSCTYTDATHRLIGAREFAAMKSSAFLINVARGGIVDHTALEVALRQGDIAGAGLDVTEPEPLPRDSPLLQMKNVMILPHIGTATNGTRRAMEKLMIDNMLVGLRGEQMPNEAN